MLFSFEVEVFLRRTTKDDFCPNQRQRLIRYSQVWKTPPEQIFGEWEEIKNWENIEEKKIILSYMNIRSFSSALFLGKGPSFFYPIFRF